MDEQIELSRDDILRLAQNGAYASSNKAREVYNFLEVMAECVDFTEEDKNAVARCMEIIDMQIEHSAMFCDAIDSIIEEESEEDE